MSLTSVRILIVDDDETMRLACRRFLAKCEISSALITEEAASGEEAIEMLSQREFDCILTDYRMGAMSGIDVLAFARRTRPKAVRILFTGFAAATVHQAAMVQADVHDFLEKPMTTTELETLLRDRLVEPFLKPLAKRAAQTGSSS